MSVESFWDFFPARQWKAEGFSAVHLTVNSFSSEYEAASLSLSIASRRLESHWALSFPSYFGLRRSACRQCNGEITLMMMYAKKCSHVSTSISIFKFVFTLRSIS